MPTPSKSIMVSQMMHIIAFTFSSLRLHLILSRTQKMDPISLWFSASLVLYWLYEALSTCPKCKANQYKSDRKTPQAYFQYLPLIPQLHAMVSNLSYAKKIQYRSKHQHNPTKVTDTFDGAHYRSLLETFVTISDEELLMWFFSDPRDVVLGFSTDGFGPFKRCNKTAWPFI